RPAADEDDNVPALEAIEDEDDVKVRRLRRDEPEEDDDDDETERRRRTRRKRRQRSEGAYADCPNCDARGDAQRVGFTWWGGLVGRAVVSGVRCNECGTCYSGRTGKSNDIAIAIYLGISLVFGLMVGACAIAAAIM